MGWYGFPDGTAKHISIRETKWGDLPPKHQLNNCPKCGSERVDLWYVGAEGTGGWRVICRDCQYLPDILSETEDSAVILWNGGI